MGNPDEFREGEVKVVRVAGDRVGVARYLDTLYAFEDRCTHDDGPLCEGELRGCEIECPRHGARFDIRDGHVTRAPALIPLATYDVEVKEGQVYVTLPD